MASRPFIFLPKEPCMILSRSSLALTLALVLGGLTARPIAAGYAGAFSAEQACTATVNKPKAGKA